MIYCKSFIATYYVMTDHLGSVLQIIDTAHKPVANYSYSDWGVRNIRSRDLTNASWVEYFNRGYCGHEHLPEFSLVNMGARIYDPIDMRFISPDPMVQDPTLPQNFNRYSYCLNNPINYTDPTGEILGIDDFLVGLVTRLVEGRGFKAAIEEGARRTKYCGKIWKGLFTTGYKQGFWNRTFELASRFIWQNEQTTFGLYYNLLANLCGDVTDVDYYGGTTVVTSKWVDGNGAVTLGNFITGSSEIKADPTNRIFQHEFGHYIQGRNWGLFYLRVIGVPSFFSASFGSNHSKFWTEIDANNRAFKYFRQNIPTYTYEDWKLWKNPLSEFLRNPYDSKYGTNQPNNGSRRLKIADYLMLR